MCSRVPCGEVVVLALLLSLRLRHHRLMRAAAAHQHNKKDTVAEVPECSTRELDTSTDHQLSIIECVEFMPDTMKGETLFIFVYHNITVIYLFFVD